MTGTTRLHALFSWATRVDNVCGRVEDAAARERCAPRNVGVWHIVRVSHCGGDNFLRRGPRQKEKIESAAANDLREKYLHGVGRLRGDGRSGCVF